MLYMAGHIELVMKNAANDACFVDDVGDPRGAQAESAVDVVQLCDALVGVGNKWEGQVVGLPE